MSFSLKTLLIAMGVFGAALALLLAAPPSFAVPVLVFISVALTGAFTAGVVYGRSNVRAFCIGALFPAGGTLVALTFMLCAMLIRFDLIKDFPSLFVQFNMLAFTVRVWTGTSWVMEVLAGLTIIRLRMALQRGVEDDQN